MHLYSGMSTQFMADTANSRIVDDLIRSFQAEYRHKPSDAEIRSWQNSLSRFARVLELGDLSEQGIIVEYRMPLTSKRLDVLVTGKSRNDDASGVVVELKQWDRVASSEVDECVETFVGGGVRTMLHPSVQAMSYRRYLLDSHTAFNDGGIGLQACSYLHNMPRAEAAALFAPEFEQLVDLHPTYVADGIEDLAEFLTAHVGKGGGEPLLQKILAGRYRPNAGLLNHVASVIEDEPSFVLLDEQRVACNDIIAKVRARNLSPQKTVMIIHGGPGTGKSLIAVNLMAEMAKQNVVVVHATGSRAFTKTMQKTVGKRAKDLFKYFNNFTSAEEDAVDLIVADESHRIRVSSNTRWTKASEKSDLPQIDELIRAAKVTAFFIDDKQVVRPAEVGSSTLIRDAARRVGARLIEHELEAQFRCNGSDAFIQWVDNTLGLENTPQILWNDADAFDLNVVDSVHELEDEVRSRIARGESARLVAGYCWPWSKPNADGTLVNDVVVGDWSMPWNAQPDASRLAKGIPKADFWATDAGGVEQVGCVYTAQGFEFDHVGIIWGTDLVYRRRIGWVGQPQESNDSTVKRSAKKDPDGFTRLVAHTYRVLLTRGMKSCSVYFEDRETEDFVLSRIELNNS
jgi:uncharacterized protein